MEEQTTIKEMVQMIAATRPDELGCDECFEQLDRFAELVLAGKNAAEALPLVQDHLARCGDCREEFEALLVALQSTTFSPRPDTYPS
jgi:hypothetical protein